MQKIIEKKIIEKKKTGSLLNYCSDESNNPPLNDDNPPTVSYNADPITNSESFKYKSSIAGKTSNSRKQWKHWARKYKD